MRPSRPYHAVTAQHREPGGLRRLDFFMDRVWQSLGDDDPAGYKIWDVGCGSGNIAIPLAVMGFQVTGTDLSDVAIKTARQAAQEVEVTINFLVSGIEAVSGQFDFIIYEPNDEPLSDLITRLSFLRDKLAPRGRILVTIKHGRNDYQAMTRSLRQAGFWITASENASVGFRKFFYGAGHARLKRGSRLFHILDAWDNRLCHHWPRVWSDGWLFEIQKADEHPLVVQLIPTLGRGGAERIVMQLAERLPAHGFAVMTIAHINGGDLVKDFKDKKLSYLILPRLGFLGRWTNFWKLRRLLVDLHPALVHTHLFGSDFWGRLAAHATGIRTIITTEHNVSPDLSFWRTLALKMLKGQSRIYVAISQRVKDYLVSSIHIPENKIQVIYNGLNLKRVKHRSNSFFHDIPKLICVGRLEAQKNPELLLRALAPIKQPWVLSLVGTGSLESELKELAVELKLTPRVNFLGLRSDVPELLAEHDLFLFPSRWEGFGLAVLEAATAGVPVITSDLPVLREFLDETKVTFVPSDNSAAWTSAIRSALADPTPFLAKARHAAVADWSRFSEEHMVAQYAQLYRQITKNE